ncbi:mucin-2-like [Episyrphus balteatus]|uniref:mucin-2-like n=1 Tax=Episyrphus balteatus TaxID=286459 RepID=UPI00248670AE|nr:mucin-2-like [Episyrphus balteatus]XP_055858240.1 mucin-2-like [Episyrphus balteatus]
MQTTTPPCLPGRTLCTLTPTAGTSSSTTLLFISAGVSFFPPLTTNDHVSVGLVASTSGSETCVFTTKPLETAADLSIWVNEGRSATSTPTGTPKDLAGSLGTAVPRSPFSGFLAITEAPPSILPLSLSFTPVSPMIKDSYLDATFTIRLPASGKLATKPTRSILISAHLAITLARVKLSSRLPPTPDKLTEPPAVTPTEGEIACLFLLGLSPAPATFAGAATLSTFGTAATPEAPFEAPDGGNTTLEATKGTDPPKPAVTTGSSIRLTRTPIFCAGNPPAISPKVEEGGGEISTIYFFFLSN